MRNFKSFKSKKIHNQVGFATIDLMVYLIAAAVILAWLGANGADMWLSYKVSRFNADVDTISTAVNDEYGNKAGYSGVSMDTIKRVLPDHIGDGQGTNTFGGDYTVAAGTNVRTYTICGTSLESKAGFKAAAKWRDASYTEATERVCINFGK